MHSCIKKRSRDQKKMTHIRVKSKDSIGKKNVGGKIVGFALKNFSQGPRHHQSLLQWLK